MAVVADSSAWIDYFAGREVPALDDAIRLEIVVLPPIVVSELVSGARRGKDVQAIEHLLGSIPIHATPLDHWVRVGELRRLLLSKGISVTVPDAHVAQCALDLDAPLLTRDAIFTRIARHTPLRLHHD